MVIPSTVTGMKMLRNYQIIILFLSPLCIIGGKVVFEKILKFNFFQLRNIKTKSLVISLVSILLIINFLFQSGLIFEITDDVPLSYSLSYNKFLDQFTFEQDIATMKWLPKHVTDETIIYSDVNGFLILFNHGYFQRGRVKVIKDPDEIKDNEIIYLKYGIVAMDKIMLSQWKGGE